MPRTVTREEREEGRVQVRRRQEMATKSEGGIWIYYETLTNSFLDLKRQFGVPRPKDGVALTREAVRIVAKWSRLRQ